MKHFKKLSSVLLAIAMTVTLVSVTKNISAGDGMNFADIIKGINSDGTTVTAGATLSISMSDLNKKIDNFSNRYDGVTTKVTWSVTSADYSTNEIVMPIYKNGVFTVTVSEKHVGMYYSLSVDDPTYTNYGGERFEVVSSGTSDKTTYIITSGPSIDSVFASKTILKKDITVNVSGYGAYFPEKDPSDVRYTYEKIVKLYRNGKLYGTRKTKDYQVVFKNVPVSYGKKDTFKVALFMNLEGNEVAGPSNTYYITSEKLGKNTVYATKISKNQAYLRWSGVSGAQGYLIYKGNKKVKTVKAKVYKCAIKKKGAGSGKYKVVPYVKSGKKVYKGKSNAAKLKANQITYNRSLNPSSHSYATCDFELTKVSLSGSTYTVTGYAVNNRIFTMKKYKSLKVGIYVDGKKGFMKTYKNYRVNVGDTRAKKIVLKIKGKAGLDLAHGNISLTVGEDPDWD